MTKTELVQQVAGAAGMQKRQAQQAVDALFSSISDALSRGDKVQLVGFGTFEVRERSERIGRNPQSGEEMRIPAKKVPAFKAGKQLKDAVVK